MNTFLIGLIYGLCAAIIWGLWPVLTRQGVTSSFTPSEIVLLRFIIAGLLLLPYFIKNAVYKKLNFIKSLILSASAGALYVYVTSTALEHAPAGHLGIVGTGTMMAFSAIFAYFLLSETKSKRQILGYVFVFFGMLIVNVNNFLMDYDANIFYGDSLLVLSGLFWALYTIASKKWQVASWDAVSIVAVYSMLIYSPIFLIFDYENINLTAKSFDALLVQGIGQGVIAAILALYFYTKAIELLGASKGSIFGSLVPAVAYLGGYVYLNEIPSQLEIIGLALTTLGLLFVLIVKKKKKI